MRNKFWLLFFLECKKSTLQLFESIILVCHYATFFSIEFGKIVCLIVIQISKDDVTYTYIAIFKLLVVIKNYFLFFQSQLSKLTALNQISSWMTTMTKNNLKIPSVPSQLQVQYGLHLHHPPNLLLIKIQILWRISLMQYHSKIIIRKIIMIRRLRRLIIKSKIL